jgi:hypothetical protein
MKEILNEIKAYEQTHTQLFKLMGRNANKIAQQVAKDMENYGVKVEINRLGDMIESMFHNFSSMTSEEFANTVLQHSGNSGLARSYSNKLRKIVSKSEGSDDINQNTGGDDELTPSSEEKNNSDDYSALYNKVKAYANKKGITDLDTIFDLVDKAREEAGKKKSQLM